MEYEIRAAMKDAGIPAPDRIIVDGKIHRFPTNGKRGDKAGYYRFWDHGNGFIAGFFGDWRTGISQRWCSKKAHELTPGEKRKVAEVHQAEEARRQSLAEQAREAAKRLLAKAKSANSNHPYLQRKRIRPLGSIKQLKNLLLVPVVDSTGQLHALQFIHPDGSKRFLAGTRVAEHFFTIGEGEPFYICEGYATAASVYEAVEGQGTVIVAFNAGNVLPVSKVIRKAHLDARITICADNDQWTPGNPGLTKATEAAKVIGALLAVPKFHDTSTQPTDFNDLAQLEGLEAVRACLDQAKYPKLSEEEVEAELDRVATLTPVQYDRTREETAKRLKVRVSTLDEEVKKRRPKQGEGDRAVIVEDLEPWAEAVNGAELLGEIKGVIHDHVVLKPKQATAISLWAVLTFCYDSFRVLPMLALTSPEKRCGKTTLLEVLAGLVKAPLPASNISPAALFRVIEAYKPCLLIDEADTFAQGNDELRGIINSGHTRASAFVIRVNGETLEPERFCTWGPKVIALIGQLPDTNRDRSVEIRLERKLPGEKVRRLPLDFADKMKPLKRKCLRWVQDNLEALKSATPDIPNVGNDRAIDNWTPLFAIAHVAGGEWPEMAEKAMLAIERISDSTTIRQELLQDIQEVFNDRERISSRELVESLAELEDRPWGEWRHGKPLTANGLARLLKPFGIKSELIRDGEKVFRGYRKKMFTEAFKRYLASASPTQSVTTLQPNKINKLGQSQNVTKDEAVTLSNGDKCLKSFDCNSVTLQNQGAEEEGIPEGNEEQENLALF